MSRPKGTCPDCKLPTAECLCDDEDNEVMTTADPDKPCPHEDFHTEVGINRLTSEPDGPVTAYIADIRIRCVQCDEPFRWVGVPAGMKPDRPMVSIDETELHAPIRPASADPDFGLGIPGFAIRMNLRDSRAADSVGESGSRPGLNRGGALQRETLMVLVPPRWRQSRTMSAARARTTARLRLSLSWISPAQGIRATGARLAEVRRAYVVRDAGTTSRLGKIYKVYPYTLRALIDAMEDARFRSFAGEPQVVIKVEGAQRTVFRRFEHGREVPASPDASSSQ